MNTKPSLQDVLQRINESLDDFSSKPARTAFDRGAFGDLPLHKVAIWGDVDAAQVLIENGADVNAAGEDEDTPLHRAVAGGHPHMIAFLSAHGADIQKRNIFDNTAWDEAQSASDPKPLIDALLGRGLES